MPPIVLLALVLTVTSLACERRPVGRSGESAGPVVARVNGHPLYQRDLESYLPPGDRDEATAEDRGTSFRRWLSTELLYEEAQRSGLEISRDIDLKLEQYRRELIADRFVQEMLDKKAVVSDAEVMAYYKAHHDEFNLEVRVSHILTSSMEDAQDALEMLKKRPFAWVARKMSVDKHTGAGGDLGYLSKGNMPAEFENVVFKMRVGEVSGIVESEFGYHILKLTDVRPAINELPFEAVAQEISRELLLQKRTAVYDSLLTSLRSRAKITVNDPNLQYALELTDSLESGRKMSDVPTTPAVGHAAPEPAGADTTGGE